MVGFTESFPSMLRPPLLSVAILTGIQVTSSLAATLTPVATEQAMFGNMPVVLSAARLIQPLDDAPGAVTVIDRTMIEASGARDVAELLRYVPGFQVGRARGTAPLTTYHGLSDDAPRRLLVRVDGRSAYSPYFVSGVEWAKISVDIDDVERIEVFRGSNAAAYGSNAFLGIVDIITRPAVDTPRFRARITEGANGLQERVVSLRQRLGDATARLTLGQEREDGIDGRHDSYRHQRIDGRIDWQITAEDSIEMHMGFVDTRAATGTTGDQTNPQRDSNAYTGFGQVRWRRQLGADNEFKLTYYHQEERFDDPGFFIPSLAGYLSTVLNAPLSAVIGVLAGSGIAPTASVDGALETRALRDDLEFEHRVHMNPQTRLVWGGGVRSDRVSSIRIFNRSDAVQLRQQRLFANVEYRRPPSWTFNAGAMLEDTDGSGPRLSPRLAVNLHLSPLTSIRAAASRGYRNLSPYERKADVRYTESSAGIVLAQTFQPSGDLRPEEVTVREIGFRHHSGDGLSSVDLRVFDETVRHLLNRDTFPTNVPDALQAQYPALKLPETPKYLGNGRADITGAELSALYRWHTDAWVGGHYTYTDIDSPQTEAELSAPREAFHLFAATRLPRDWQISGAWGYVSTMSWYDDDDGINGYHYASARIAKRWRLGQTTAEVSVGMDRIMGAVSDYRPEYARPPQGYVTLRLTH